METNLYNCININIALQICLSRNCSSFSPLIINTRSSCLMEIYQINPCLPTLKVRHLSHSQGMTTTSSTTSLIKSIQLVPTKSENVTFFKNYYSYQHGYTNPFQCHLNIWWKEPTCFLYHINGSILCKCQF